jgi:hypothetical protein
MNKNCDTQWKWWKTLTDKKVSLWKDSKQLGYKNVGFVGNSYSRGDLNCSEPWRNWVVHYMRGEVKEHKGVLCWFQTISLPIYLHIVMG